MICECITKKSSRSAQTEQVAALPIRFPLALSLPAFQTRVGSTKLLPLPCHAPTFLQKGVGGNLIIFKWALAQIACEAKRGFHWNTNCVENGLEDDLRLEKWSSQTATYCYRSLSFLQKSNFWCGVYQQTGSGFLRDVRGNKGKKRKDIFRKLTFVFQGFMLKTKIFCWKRVKITVT